jgi:hypothetical protein
MCDYKNKIVAAESYQRNDDDVADPRRLETGRQSERLGTIDVAGNELKDKAAEGVREVRHDYQKRIGKED